MSIECMKYLWEKRRDLKGAELLCAIAIADHADAEGKCFPSIAYIARKLRCTKRHARDLVNRLQEKKVFIYTAGSGRGNRSLFRFINGEQSCPLPDKEKGNNSAIKGEQSCTETGNNPASPIYEESLKEPPVNHSEEDREQPVNSSAEDEIETYLELLRHIYKTNVLPNEKRWQKMIIQAAKNNIPPLQIAAALKALLGQNRTYPVTPENVLDYALEQRAKIFVKQTDTPTSSNARPKYSDRNAEMEARGFPKMTVVTSNGSH